jgi:hypothetical protein
MTGRILVFTTLAVSALSILGWRKCARILPVVRNQRTRTMAGIAGCLLGFIFAALCLICLPPIHFSVGIILLTWALALTSILGGVGYGLTEAAREHTATTDSLTGES